MYTCNIKNIIQIVHIYQAFGFQYHVNYYIVCFRQYFCHHYCYMCETKRQYNYFNRVSWSNYGAWPFQWEHTLRKYQHQQLFWMWRVAQHGGGLRFINSVNKYCNHHTSDVIVCLLYISIFSRIMKDFPGHIIIILYCDHDMKIYITDKQVEL